MDVTRAANPTPGGVAVGALAGWAARWVTAPCGAPLGVQFAASLLFRKVTGDRSAVAARQVDAPLLNGNLMTHAVPV